MSCVELRRWLGPLPPRSLERFHRGSPLQDRQRLAQTHGNGEEGPVIDDVRAHFCRNGQLYGVEHHAGDRRVRKSRAQPARADLLLLALPPLRQIFLGQRRSGRLGLHHDARNSPAAGFFDRLDAVDAARD